MHNTHIWPQHNFAEIQKQNVYGLMWWKFKFSASQNSKQLLLLACKNMTAFTTEKGTGKCPYYLSWEYSSYQNFSCFAFNLGLMFSDLFYASEVANI
jgi:hypothetical protein